ncbi:MAG: hypothetical protein ACE5FS_14710, partial [Paracoccaceae bacterium]
MMINIIGILAFVGVLMAAVAVHILTLMYFMRKNPRELLDLLIAGPKPEARSATERLETGNSYPEMGELEGNGKQGLSASK